MENKTYSLYTHLTAQELYEKLQTSNEGLNTEQAKKKYLEWGPNKLEEATITWLNILKNQFYNPFIFLLIVIAIIYLGTHQITESCIIFLIILINSSIGFYQEYQSNYSMKVLRSYLQTNVTVKRSNQIETISTDQLVPGDILILSAGDIIPADCRFIEAENLVINEASLTGESLPVKKSNLSLQETVTTLYNANNIGFTGTIITDGHATALVFATGKNTILGGIALLTTQTITKSALTVGTMQLAKIVLFLVLVSLILIVLINIFFKQEQTSLLNLLLFSSALAITAIPTALPIVITFCLTKGATALQKHKIIVKRLSAIEDLGGIEVFCTDKTGTLTENSLTIKNIYSDNEELTLLHAALSSELLMNAHKKIPQGFDLAVEQKLTPENKAQLQNYSIVASRPFTYERHRAIFLTHTQNNYTLITKGSAEYVIQQCTSLTNEQLTTLNGWIKNNELENNRVLAVATKELTSYNPTQETLEDHDRNYQTISLISFCDPLKTTAATAIKKAQALNVRIKILSGDSAYVCYTIAHQLGLENNINNVVLGDDFEKSTEEQKKILAYNRTVFARVTPEQKYHIISYLQQTYSVGYIGDGINDAPALKIANVGIAVNDSSPVAQQAAEIILLQKSLLHIILGIEEGRKTIINTLKYIKITIASNIGNFYSLAISSLLINYLPMLPLQLLFLDLLTDLPLISISTDDVSKQELQKPLHYDMKEISFVTLIFGLVSSPFDFVIFKLFKAHPATLQTSWFIASALTQLVLIFSLRTKVPFWKSHHPSITLVSFCALATAIIIALPFTTIGHTFFHFVTPTKTDMMFILIVVIAYFITTESVKIFYYRNR